MTIFLSSDHHFDHAKILTFRSEVDGELIRPGFSSVEEMNETMIERHNAVVGPSDTWYCLGDLMFGSLKNLNAVMCRLNGKKRLVLGNHDYQLRWAYESYFGWFNKVMESRRFGSLLLTHRPTLLGRQEVRILGNVHGHIHEKNIDDPRYLNVSVEQTGYAPVSLDWIVETYRGRGIKVTID